MIQHQPVDFMDISEALAAYRKITRSPRNRNTTFEFFKFLDLADQGEKLLSGESVSELTRSRLDWIRGPNAKTLYKAWLVKNAIHI